METRQSPKEYNLGVQGTTLIQVVLSPTPLKWCSSLLPPKEYLGQAEQLPGIVVAGILPLHVSSGGRGVIRCKRIYNF
jgi:hypothetical protein